MTTTLIRGRLLSFHRAPTSIDDSAAYSYESDGALLVKGGQIIACGTPEELSTMKQSYTGHYLKPLLERDRA